MSKKKERTILQYNDDGKLLGEHASPLAAAEAVGKEGFAANNILLCAAQNHLSSDTSRKAYGSCWRFSDDKQ